MKCEEEVFLTKIVPVQKQSNSSDCGLLALAFAFDLANNLEPSIITYSGKSLGNIYLYWKLRMNWASESKVSK